MTVVNCHSCPDWWGYINNTEMYHLFSNCLGEHYFSKWHPFLFQSPFLICSFCGLQNSVICLSFLEQTPTFRPVQYKFNCRISFLGGSLCPIPCIRNRTRHSFCVSLVEIFGIMKVLCRTCLGLYIQYYINSVVISHVYLYFIIVTLLKIWN